MPDYMINIAMAVLATLLLTRWIIRKYIEKNILCFIAAEMALLIGIKFLSGSVMAVWSLLVLESYIDITEQQIFCVPTWLLIGIEIIYMLLRGTFLNIPMSTMLFPMLLILIMSIKAYADGDRELYLAIMLDAYNHGVRPDSFIVYHMLISCIVFVLYVGIKNLIRMMRHKAVVGNGAFVPAMAAGYFILALLKF